MDTGGLRKRRCHGELMFVLHAKYQFKHLKIQKVLLKS